MSDAGGYAIRLSSGVLDLATAQELAAEAEKARAGGDQVRARELLKASLALWTGEPLANVPGPHADTERTRLSEWRLQLIEARLDMELDAGCHAEAVSELTALTAAYPLRERLRELLMLALYRSGRQAEALAVYADTRRLLADELGVDPRPSSPGCSSGSSRPTRTWPGPPRRPPPRHPSGRPNSPPRCPISPDVSPSSRSCRRGSPPPTPPSWPSPRSPGSAAWARRRSPCTSPTRPARTSPTASCT